MYDLTDSARIQEGIIYNNLCRKFISWFQRRLLNSTSLSLQNALAIPKMIKSSSEFFAIWDKNLKQAHSGFIHQCNAHLETKNSV